MKKPFLFLLIILNTATSVLAQEQQTATPKEKAIAPNFNAHQNAFPTFDNLFKRQLGFPSLEYLMRKGKKIFSIELAKITINNSPTYQANTYPQVLFYTDKNIQAMLRLQWQRLFRENNKVLQPYWGGALTPHYVYTQRNAKVSNLFNKSISSIGISHHFSVGTYYNFGRYFLNANALLGIGSISVQTENRTEPTLPAEARSTSIFNFEILNQDHLFRIGIGMKL